MLGTGLKLKFFIIVFIGLSITAVSISAIHYHFFRAERHRLIELNLQQNATLLANADLTLSKKEFSDLGQEFSDQLIGDDKVNMIVGIYSPNGQILYKNDNAHIFHLPETIEMDFNEWEMVEQKDYLIKYLTTRDEDQGRIIKVGMILNQSLLRWKDLNQRIFLFGGILLLIVSLLSSLLTYALFRPVRILAEQVNLMADKVEHGETVDLKYWSGPLGPSATGRDEFRRLITSLYKLANRISESQKTTQRWSSLMAHELKTPMTILRMSIEKLVTAGNVPRSQIEQVESDLVKLEHVVMDFLEWASAENDVTKPQLHVINVTKRSADLIHVIQEAYPKVNIELANGAANLKVFCNPLHFDQLLNNLLVNAAKYATNAVKLEIGTHSIMVHDDGPGIPATVLENLGRPFNRSTKSEKSGHGLGLAWVNTIIRKYDWKLSVANFSGAQIIITFPNT